MNLFDLTGKKALVVGHEGKLGPIWVETLSDAGATVVGIGPPALDFLRAYQDEYIEDLPEITPDIIVCNAAIDTPPTQTDARFFSRFEDTLRVNLTGHAMVIAHYLARMKHKGGGLVVFIGSIMGHRAADPTNYTGGFEKPVAYNLSKAALIHFAPCLTRQCGEANIRAVSLSFGPVDTGKLSQEFLDTVCPKIPMRRPVSVLSLKRSLLFACCTEEFAGADCRVDSGWCA
jgi:NAD(P)-dependent dehydrogenase (short-subunit alcohol dehydrogenase family)